MVLEFKQDVYGKRAKITLVLCSFLLILQQITEIEKTSPFNANTNIFTLLKQLNTDSKSHFCYLL